MFKYFTVNNKEFYYQSLWTTSFERQLASRVKNYEKQTMQIICEDGVFKGKAQKDLEFYTYKIDTQNRYSYLFCVEGLEEWHEEVITSFEPLTQEEISEAFLATNHTKIVFI